MAMLKASDEPFGQTAWFKADVFGQASKYRSKYNSTYHNTENHHSPAFQTPEQPEPSHTDAERPFAQTVQTLTAALADIDADGKFFAKLHEIYGKKCMGMHLSYLPPVLRTALILQVMLDGTKANEIRLPTIKQLLQSVYIDVCTTASPNPSTPSCDHLIKHLQESTPLSDLASHEVWNNCLVACKGLVDSWYGEAETHRLNLDAMNALRNAFEVVEEHALSEQWDDGPRWGRFLQASLIVSPDERTREPDADREIFDLVKNNPDEFQIKVANPAVPFDKEHLVNVATTIIKLLDAISASFIPTESGSVSMRDSFFLQIAWRMARAVVPPDLELPVEQEPKIPKTLDSIFPIRNRIEARPSLPSIGVPPGSGKKRERDASGSYVIKHSNASGSQPLHDQDAFVVQAELEQHAAEFKALQESNDWQSLLGLFRGGKVKAMTGDKDKWEIDGKLAECNDIYLEVKHSWDEVILNFNLSSGERRSLHDSDDIEDRVFVTAYDLLKDVIKARGFRLNPPSAWLFEPTSAETRDATKRSKPVTLETIAKEIDKKAENLGKRWSKLTEKVQADAIRVENPEPVETPKPIELGKKKTGNEAENKQPSGGNDDLDDIDVDANALFIISHVRYVTKQSIHMNYRVKEVDSYASLLDQTVRMLESDPNNLIKLLDGECVYANSAPFKFSTDGTSYIAKAKFAYEQQAVPTGTANRHKFDTLCALITGKPSSKLPLVRKCEMNLDIYDIEGTSRVCTIESIGDLSNLVANLVVTHYTDAPELQNVPIQANTFTKQVAFVKNHWLPSNQSSDHAWSHHRRFVTNRALQLKFPYESQNEASRLLGVHAARRCFYGWMVCHGGVFTEEVGPVIGPSGDVIPNVLIPQGQGHYAAALTMGSPVQRYHVKLMESCIEPYHIHRTHNLARAVLDFYKQDDKSNPALPDPLEMINIDVLCEKDSYELKWNRSHLRAIAGAWLVNVCHEHQLDWNAGVQHTDRIKHVPMGTYQRDLEQLELKMKLYCNGGLVSNILHNLPKHLWSCFDVWLAWESETKPDDRTIRKVAIFAYTLLTPHVTHSA